MTKKKYRQQSDTTPLSESSDSSVPVSHSDDEGNVVIDTTTDAPAPIYGPIPELVELESSSLSSPSSPSVQDPGPGPVTESSPESSDLVLASVPELALERVLESVPVLAPERVLEPAPVPASEPIAPSQAPGVSEQPLSVLVLDSSSSSTTNTTPTSSSTPNTTSTSKWIQFKSWFSKCCRACCCCCCCCHRRRNRDAGVTSS